MDRQITVYLHIGNKLMPKSFVGVPGVGEIVHEGAHGRLAVARIEYDQQGDAHLHLSPVPPPSPGTAPSGAAPAAE